MQKKNSVLIIVLGWLLIITSIISFTRRITDLFKWDFHRGFPGVVTYDWIFVLFLIAGIGLLMFKDWARKLTIILFIIKLFFYLQSIYRAFTPAFKDVKLPSHYWYVIGAYFVIYSALVLFLTRPKIQELFKVDKKQFISTWIIGLSIFYIYVFMLVLMYISKIDTKFLRYSFQLIFPVFIGMILPPLVIGGFLLYTLRNKKMWKKLSPRFKPDLPLWILLHKEIPI